MLEVDRVSLGSPERKALMHQPGLGEDLSRRKIGAPPTKRGAVHSADKAHSYSQGGGREVGPPSGAVITKAFKGGGTCL